MAAGEAPPAAAAAFAFAPPPDSRRLFPTVAFRSRAVAARARFAAGDLPSRAVIASLAPETPAAQMGGGKPLLEPYDELLSIGGVAVESAVQAVKLIREAPAGVLVGVHAGMLVVVEMHMQRNM